MKATKIILSKKKVEKYSGELLVSFVARDSKGKMIGSERFSRELESLGDFNEFTGKKNQLFQLYPELGTSSEQLKCKRLQFHGLGDIEDLSETENLAELLRIVGGNIAQQCKKLKVQTVGIEVPHFSKTAEINGLNSEVVGQFLTEGILLGAYQFVKYIKKTEDSYAGLKKVEYLTETSGAALRRGFNKGSNSAQAACVARNMANEPGNCWRPLHFAEYAQKIAKKLGLECTVLEKSQMVKLGMGGIVAVNQGSKEEPKMIILDYRPEKSGKSSEKPETILLVGKGLTFDSGGISLKPAAKMGDMKYDMCGGAAVISAMEGICREKPRQRVVAIIPSTDNMAGGGAVKPGDVITHYGGITSEIDNTDAEGRLILADALAYGIEKYKPNCVIDLATLTGAVIMALGHHYTGLMSNNDNLSLRLVKAGEISGEPLWRLPLGPMYAKQIESKVADVKNSGGRPAGSITAAEYLQKFVAKVPWAHLDIAGTAWDFTEKSYIPGGPSGTGVRTLIELLRMWESGKLNVEVAKRKE